MTIINPFEELGIQPTLNIEEVRKAYHRKAKEVHPDQFTEEEQIQWAHNQMVHLNQAYEEAVRLVERRAVSPYQQMLSCEDAVELAKRMLAQGEPERALRQLMRADKKDATWYDMQGQVMMALEQYQTAEQSFRIAVRLEPENIRYRRGALDAHTAAREAASLGGRVKKLLHMHRARLHDS